MEAGEGECGEISDGHPAIAFGPPRRAAREGDTIHGCVQSVAGDGVAEAEGRTRGEQFPGGAQGSDGFGFARQFGGKELPEPRIESPRRAPPSQHAPLPRDDKDLDADCALCGPTLGGGESVGLAPGVGPATAAQGTPVAVGVVGSADEGAQLHERLVQAGAARPRFGGEVRGGMHERVCQGPESALQRRGLGVAPEGVEPAEDPGDIAIEDGCGLVERDAADGAGGVPANAGQREQLRDGLGQPTGAAVGDDLGGALEVAGASVVTEALPEFQDRRHRGLGQGLDGGEGLHPPIPVRDDRLDLGLLEHDLGHPNGVGIPGPSPGQIPSGAVEMAEEQPGDPGCRRGRELGDWAVLGAAARQAHGCAG